MKPSIIKKNEQLGMNHSTAYHRLRKNMMFLLVKESGRDTCHRCGCSIDSVDDLSIEHIEPWLDSDDPKGKFFDLINVTFSHLKCNVADRRQTHTLKPEEIHGTVTGYTNYACRCDACKAAKAADRKAWALRKQAE